jgi:GWxTD domain-containing protein
MEIYYAFYPRLVTYQSIQGNGLKGGIKFEIKIWEKEQQRLILNNLSYIPLTIDDTTAPSFQKTFVSKSGYRLEFGDYKVQLFVKDSLGIRRNDSVSFDVKAHSFGPPITMSELDLCTNVKQSTNKDDPFYKNGLEVIPNPNLLFGATVAPMLFIYAELYHLDRDSTYAVKVAIAAMDGSIVKETMRQKKFGVRNAVEASTINVSSLPSGRYRCNVVLFNLDGSEVCRSAKPFYVYNPHIKPPPTSAGSMAATALAGMTFEELGDEFRKAKYLAAREDIALFNELSNIEGRRQFLGNFWTETEKGKPGKDPVTRMEYLNRVETANKRYRVLGKEGWQTDRGRVLLLNNEPDEIERFPSSEQNKPYEIWHYYRIENGVEFVFVDRSGFGEYLMVHSTKRGEFRDEQWQRYLQ